MQIRTCTKLHMLPPISQRLHRNTCKMPRFATIPCDVTARKDLRCCPCTAVRASQTSSTERTCNSSRTLMRGGRWEIENQCLQGSRLYVRGSSFYRSVSFMALFRNSDVVPPVTQVVRLALLFFVQQDNRRCVFGDRSVLARNATPTHLM